MKKGKMRFLIWLQFDSLRIPGINDGPDWFSLGHRFDLHRTLHGRL